jgi:DNA-binding protein H-NS
MPNMIQDSLEKLGDDELRAVIDRSNELLAERDRQRKEKALEQARAILAGAGLSLRDVATGKPAKNGNGKTIYREGTQYQHPTNKTLTWKGKGQKPNWLRVLESQGGKAVEMAPDAANDNSPPVRKSG